VSARPLPPVYVATLHRPSGDSGIHSHVRVFMDLLAEHGGHGELVSPFDATPALVYPAFGAARLVRACSRSCSVWWWERSHHWLLRRRILARVNGLCPAVIYAQDPLSAHAALAARRRGKNIEVVLSVHYNVSIAEEWVGKGLVRWGGRLFRGIEELERATLPRVDRLIFVSRFMEEQVLSRIPEAAGVPRWVVPNCAASEANDVRHIPRSKDEDPESEAIELLTIGSLEPRKNQEFLLKVLSHAHRLGRPYRLTIAGDGVERDRLPRIAERLGLGTSVEFLGHVPRAARLLGRHRVYVHAARMENCPIVLIEAMAAARPVLAAPVGGISEMFSHGVEGLYWELGDPRRAAEQLIALLENSELYQRMARAAVARYRNYFSPKTVGPRLLEAVFGRCRWDQQRTIGRETTLETTKVMAESVHR
jgi:glycosyltransferase involved in cell wall biosynthesis